MRRLPDYKLTSCGLTKSIYLSSLLVDSKLAKNVNEAKKQIEEFSVSIARSPTLEMITGVGTHTRVLKSTITSDVSISKLKLNSKDVLYVEDLFVRLG